MKEPQIIFQDEFLLVLDKPAGMVVNRAETTRAEETVQDWIEKKLKVKREKLKVPIQNSKFKDFYGRAGIVHRLDKDTSGLLLVAKTPEAFENLQRQFKERKVKKKYLALVHGKLKPKEGVIKASISRSPFDRKKFGVFLGGREAKTKYKRIAIYDLRFKNEKLSLVELCPETGRTHQLRVHLKYLGHPIVGDEKYAGRKTARSDRQWCPRQFLHASFLALIHPVTNQKLKFFSKLPSDLELAIIKL